MTKTIIKELAIGILLLLAIVLILGILFYDYIPNNKTVPIKIEAYNMPEDIKQELEVAVPEEQNIVRTYYIDSTDLNSYEATNDYDKGKANPFAAYEETKVKDSSNSTTNNDDTAKNNITNNTENIGQQDTEQNEVYITTPGKNS